MSMTNLYGVYMYTNNDYKIPVNHLVTPPLLQMCV